LSCDDTRDYSKVSGLAAWSENCKWYSSLPLGAELYRYFVSQSSEFFRHNPLCFSVLNECLLFLFHYRLSPETFGYSSVCQIHRLIASSDTTIIYHELRKMWKKTATTCFKGFDSRQWQYFSFRHLVYIIQVKVFWVVTSCSVVVGYQRFGGPCCLHLQGESLKYHIVYRMRGAHPTAYFATPKTLHPGLKLPDREVNHSHASAAKVKNTWSLTSTPLLWYRNKFTRLLPLPALTVERIDEPTKIRGPVVRNYWSHPYYVRLSWVRLDYSELGFDELNWSRTNTETAPSSYLLFIS
jgi:hypothetical protein